MWINKLFCLRLPKVPKSNESGKKARLKKAVAQAASGNVLLQVGRYRTGSDIENLRKAAFQK